MKKIITTMFLCSGLGLAAYAQGTINFANFVPGTINAKAFEADGVTALTGPTYEAGLYAGATAGSMALVAQSAFLTGGGAGYIASTTVTIPTVAGGSTAFIEFVAWNVSQYATFAAAQASAVGNVWAASPVFQIVLGSGPPNTPPPITGLTSLTLNPVPEPTALALLGLGSAGLMFFRRRK